MRADAVARIGISSLVVASGTGAIVALATDHRATGISLAVLGGVLGLAVAFGQAMHEEHENGALAPAPTPPTTGSTLVGVPVPSGGLTGLMAGRIMGR